MMGLVMWVIPVRFIPCYVLCEFYNFMEFIYVYVYNNRKRVIYRSYCENVNSLIGMKGEACLRQASLGF